MAKVLARHFLHQLNTGTQEAAEWVTVGGLTNVSVSPSKNDADTTDYDSDGVTEHLPASRGCSVQLQGQRKNETTGERHPGQEAVETLATQIGPDGLKGYRMVPKPSEGEPDGSKAVYAGMVSADVTRAGGGNDDPTAWEATLTFSGNFHDTAVATATPQA